MNSESIEAMHGLSSQKRELLRQLLEKKGVDLLSLPILRRPPDLAALPLSYAQQRLWFLDQLEPGSAAYNMPVALRLSGVLNVDALKQTLDEVVRRHEALRTTFAAIDGVPVQRIAPTLDLPLPLTDLSGLPQVQRDQKAEEIVQQEAHRPYDLATGPLVRAQLLRLAQTEHIVLFTMHHIVSDGWSQGVLVREVAALYEAYSRGESSPLPALQIQYVDYAHWQRQWLSGEVLQAQIDYWKEQLASAPALLALPTDRPRPAVQSHSGATLKFSVPRETTVGLYALAQQTQSTLFMVLTAAFNVLLWRCSGQDDICIGTPVANRTREELEPLIGCFVNTLVLRTRMTGDMPFTGLLEQVKNSTLDAHAHQDVPFEQLVEVLKPVRDTSYSPLFQVMLVLQNTPMTELELAGLRLQIMNQDVKQAKFDLLLNFIEDDEQQLEAGIEYCTDLFEHSTIERMAAQLNRLLQGLVANPQQGIGRLPLLDAAERRCVLEQWNDTATPYPQNSTVHGLFEAQVERTPQAVAAVFEGSALSYAELNAQANRLAHHLRGLGVGPDARVAICLERGLPMVVALLATLKAGGAYVPLDPDYPADRLAYMLEDCGPAVLLTDATCALRLPAQATVPVCRMDEHEAPWCDLSADNLSAEALGLNARHLAYVIYTSGSTGQPKGAMNEHRAVVNRLLWMQQAYGLGTADAVLQKTPFGFDVSVWEFFWPWLVGARLVLARPQGQRDPSYLLELIDREQVTTLHFVPSMLSAFLAGLPAGGARSLRRIVCSGEALPAQMVEAVHRQLPQSRLFNLYGPTEAAVDVTAAEPRPGQPVTIGRPIANTRIYILDGQREPVPVGVPGEIHIAGVQVGRGYLNRPELTEERFIRDPFASEPGARMYRTGDVGRWMPDGSIAYLGRNDHQVKLRGFRIELGEIEACVIEQPGVREAVVLVREDAGDKRLVAYVVADEGQAVEPAALREALQRKLPQYMVPSHFVLLDALPLTPNGKLDRRALPAPEVGASRVEYVAPRTPTEERLARIWAEVLGVEPVGVHDDFFELGGHSLRTIEVLSRIRTVCGMDMPLRVLFEATTVEELARHVDEAQPARGSISRIARVELQPDYEVSAAQRRMWLLHLLDSRSTAYHVPALLDLPQDVERAALERALGEVLRRHEVLRTVFVEDEDGMPRQRVREPWDVQLNVRSVQSEQELQEHFLRFMREPFDLSRGPLFRAEVLQTPDHRQRLAWCMHEIVSDGSSALILEREVTALLRMHASGEPARLPDLPIQYKDYAAWQNQLLREEDASRQYWHEHLETGMARLPLPYDRPVTDETPAGAAQYQVAVTGLAHEALVGLCRRHQVTVFMLLQASLAVWLARLTGQRDVVIAVPTSGRDAFEAEQLIGFFLNTVLLRMQVEPQRSFEEVLSHAKEVALNGLQHQHYPFEQLIEELQLPRPANQFPVTPVLFNLLSFLDREPLGDVPVGHEPLDLDAKAELELTAQEHAEGLVVKCAYRTSLFEPRTIEYLMQQWLSLLQQVSAAPGERIEALALFTDGQALTLQSPYLQFANELPPAPPVEGVLARVTRRAEEAPDAVAIEWRDGQTTYAQLEAQSNRIASQLQQLGCTPGDVVALLLRDPVEHIASVLGTMKAGAVFMTLDAGDPLARLQTLAQRVQPRWWIAEHDTAAVLHELTSRLDVPVQGLGLGASEVPGLAPLAAEPAPAVPPPDADACYIFFTSGSTGQPKPILGRAQSLAQFIDWEIEAFGLDHGCRVSQLTASTFDAFLRDVFVPLCSGGTVCVPPQPKLGPDELLQWLDASRVTHVHCVPSLLRAMLGYAQQQQDELPEMAALKRVCLSGEPVLPATVQAWQEAFGGRIELVNFYGASETTMIRCWHRITAADVARGFIPVGKPIAHTQAIVLDGQGQPCPPGVPGEIWVRSRFFTLGYYGDEARTAEVFVRNPLRPRDEERVYRSGDIGMLLDDGSLRCLGRRDGQVKVNGVRIEVGEVENALLGHPQVSEAAVLAQQGDDGANRLSAYVVAPEGSAEELSRYLLQCLPGTMQPQHITVLESLPLTSSGKIDRKALAVLDDSPAQESAAYVEPATETERIVAGLYGDVLGRERVGRDDDFFALGGHSLQALMLLARIRKTMSAEIALRALFEERTVQRMAKAVDEFIAARQQSGVVEIADVLAEALLELDAPGTADEKEADASRATHSRSSDA